MFHKVPAGSATESGSALDRLIPNWYVGLSLTWGIFQGGLTHGQVREAKGTLMLKTPEGDLELQLPPSAVKGIKKGDHLTVRIGVRAADGGGQHHAGPGNGSSGTKSP